MEGLKPFDNFLATSNIRWGGLRGSHDAEKYEQVAKE
jgi:hypothetical protein